METVKPTDDEPVVTKTRTRLGPDYEERLAAEAEAGFDPAILTRRHAGRPGAGSGGAPTGQ